MTQQEALNILKAGRSVFLTGAPGSGKTYVLNKYIEYLKDNGVGVAVTAPTGIAATHLGGQTIHSWSGIGIRQSVSESDIKKILKRRGVGGRIKRTQTLIIDEVSMLHDFRLDIVDKVCRYAKEVDEPFGGMQLVLSGDFFQLPPVSRGADSRFVTESEVWREMDPDVCYLQEQHRHGDDILCEVLNNIRRGEIGNQTLAAIKERMNASLNHLAVEPTRLFTHNVDVDTMNEKRLREIKEPIKIYNAKTEGTKRFVESLLKSCLAPEVLSLKKGSAVMFVKNNFENGYVNGTLGTVVGYSGDGYPVIKTSAGKEVVAYPEQWVMEEDGKIKASVKQVPLRLAWAITVHKSQGMSLDGAEVDLSKTFERGMGYVAISRVRSFDGISLLGINDVALKVRGDVLGMDEYFIKKSKNAAELLKADLSKFEKAHDEFLNSLPDHVRTSYGKKKKQTTYEKTKSLLESKMSVQEIADKRELAKGTIISHIEKLAKEDSVDINHIFPPRVEFLTIKKAFEEIGDKERKLSPVFKKLGGRFSFDEIRLSRIFIDQEKK